MLTTFAIETLHCRYSTGLKIGVGLRAWNIELTLVPSVEIKPKKCSARKYVWHRFWKCKWGSKQNACLCWNSRPKSSLKIMLWEISQNLEENICAGISLLVFSCEFCEICENTFFVEQHRANASDYGSINGSGGSIGKRNWEMWVIKKGQARWKNRFKKQWFAGLKLGVLKYFVNSTGKHLFWSLFLIKLQEACKSVKKRPQHRCFPMNFSKFLRTKFFYRRATVAPSEI